MARPGGSSLEREAMDDSTKSGAPGRGRRSNAAQGVPAVSFAVEEERMPTVMRAAAPATGAGADGNADLLDPRDPAVQARLRQRTPTGGYEVPEAALVRAIRAWGQRGEREAVRALCGTLIERCMPEFKRRAWGLRHRPELMEEAIAGMIEQVLREAQDPRETFMTQNFIHYLRCCCADNFGRVLRQEGLSYRRDEQGRPAGRPLHVPQALVERIDVAAEDREDAGAQGTVIADPRDATEERMAALEAQRILSYLPDPLDRQIMVLRALNHLRWDDIAKLCGKTERTMRLRYEKSVVRLRQCIEAETAAVAL
jgi:DNA-directed RNA polymerase specialized sigma24 family protein